MNNSSLADQEMVRAVKALKAAKALLVEELLEDTVSRAYYAVLHAAKAALAVQGLTCDSHAGVRRMFGLHLVKTGFIDAEYAKILTAEREERERCDYDVEVAIDEATAQLQVKDAERFMERIRQYLEQNGVSRESL